MHEDQVNTAETKYTVTAADTLDCESAKEIMVNQQEYEKNRKF